MEHPMNPYHPDAIRLGARRNQVGPLRRPVKPKRKKAPAVKPGPGGHRQAASSSE